MSDEVLLNDLCCVCSVNVPKYKCPGCFRKTCSLPCSKRHKTQMSCTGRRDAAAPVSRSELATPQAFDRDYNFLVGMEREVEAARRTVFGAGNVWEKQPASCGFGGVGGGAGSGSNYAGRGRATGFSGGRGGRGGSRGGRAGPGSHAPPVSKRDSRLGAAARSRNISFVRAPKGMKRYLENKSTVTNKSGLIWSVEWFIPDGSRHLSSVHEETTVAEAYRALQNRKEGKKRPHSLPRGGDTDEPLKKQKTDASENVTANSDIGTEECDIHTGQSGQAMANLVDDNEHSVTHLSSTSQPSSSLPPLVPDSDEEHRNLDLGRNGDDSEDDDGPPREISSKIGHQTQTPPAPQQPSGPPYFFLHHPRPVTSSSAAPSSKQRRKPVIPVLETAKLGELLKGKTVLEFPTIWVFETPEVPSEREAELVVLNGPVDVGELGGTAIPGSTSVLGRDGLANEAGRSSGWKRLGRGPPSVSGLSEDGSSSDSGSSSSSDTTSSGDSDSDSESESDSESDSVSASGSDSELNPGLDTAMESAIDRPEPGTNPDLVEQQENRF